MVASCWAGFSSGTVARSRLLHVQPLLNTVDVYGDGKPTRVSRTVPLQHQQLSSGGVGQVAHAESDEVLKLNAEGTLPVCGAQHRH